MRKTRFFNITKLSRIHAMARDFPEATRPFSGHVAHRVPQACFGKEKVVPAQPPLTAPALSLMQSPMSPVKRTRYSAPFP